MLSGTLLRKWKNYYKTTEAALFESNSRKQVGSDFKTCKPNIAALLNILFSSPDLIAPTPVIHFCAVSCGSAVLYKKTHPKGGWRAATAAKRQ